VFSPRPCDGSCLVKQSRAEELKFQDGPSLFFYWCWHERTRVPTSYRSQTKVKWKTKSAPKSIRKEGGK
jgi:hypothetical protein